MFNHSVSTCFSQQCQQLSFFMNAPSQVCARLPSLSRFPSCLESMTVHKAALAKCRAAADSAADSDAAHFHQITWSDCYDMIKYGSLCFSHVITSHLIPCHQMSNDHGSSPAPGLVRASQILGTKSKSKKRHETTMSHGQLALKARLSWMWDADWTPKLVLYPITNATYELPICWTQLLPGCHVDSQWAETCHWIHSAVPLGSASHPFCCL